MAFRATLRRHRYMLIGVLGGIPLAGAYVIWVLFNVPRQPHLRLTVGRCAPWVGAAHPADCAYIRSHPALVLVGPGRLVRRRIQLPGHRIAETSIPQGERVLLWIDQRAGTVTPDDHWRLDPHRD